MFIDSHAHYNDHAFSEDREALLKALPAEGIDAVINIGDSLAASRTVLEMAHRYPYLYAAVGVHPENAREITDDSLVLLEEMLRDEKAVALGEIGLDFHYDDVPRPIQCEAFRRQLRLAKRLGKPVVIHDREAHGECLSILKEEGITSGVMHCFSGSVEFMREVIRQGLYIALGGVVTYKNARHAVEVAENVPLERLLLETDCPYLAPVPHRGKRNASPYIRYTAERIAALRGISLDILAAQTAENTKQLFGIQKRS